MRKFYRKQKAVIGKPPGTLIPIGEIKDHEIKTSILKYDKIKLEEKELEILKEEIPSIDKMGVTWLKINGIHQKEIMEKIGNYFNIHPLVLEDIMNTEQRPKLEDFGDYIFIVLKMLTSKENEIGIEQVSLILGTNFVISFQESKNDIFELIKERIKTEKGPIRKLGADYLAYALVDFIVDNYFIIIEKIQDQIETLDDELIESGSQKTVHELQKLKRNLLFIRKAIWPLREMLGSLQRIESGLINKNTHIFLRDAYDHIIQIIDMVETFRDLLSGMHDVYLSNISNKMNEIMKTLTIIATIFIPLTFIVGIYGMNFLYMPELLWFWGYPLILFIMALIGVFMLIYFKKKKWI